MVTFTFFGNGIITTAVFLCFLILSQQAETCDPVTNDDSKIGLIKIELTKSGNTIITIGNNWRFGQFSDSRSSDCVSSVKPDSARSTTSLPMNDNQGMEKRRRLNHTFQPHATSPPTTTNGKLMHSITTKPKISNPNKRYSNSRTLNIAPVKGTRNESQSFNNEKLANDAEDDFIYKQLPKVEPIKVHVTNNGNQLELANDDVKHVENLQNDNAPASVTESAVTIAERINAQTGLTTSICAKEEVSTEANVAGTAEMDLIDSERQLVKDRLQKIVDNHYSWNILNGEDADCGESHSDRIIGGVQASLGQFPWIARLGYTVLPAVNSTEFRCGGVLIGQQFVLTAAHCVSNLGPRTLMTRVRLGEHDVTTAMDCFNNVCAEPVQDFRPINITAHEEFMKRKYGNDIAIIKLDRPAVYNGWVSPICLPRGNTLTASYTGESAQVAGWGIMSMDTMEMAERLQTVALPILTLDQCQAEYKKKVQLTEEQICAGSIRNKDACGGDSGGPLMKVATENGSPQYFLLGVVSFGPSDCGKKEPGVYANVSYHMPWILDQVERLSI